MPNFNNSEILSNLNRISLNADLKFKTEDLGGQISIKVETQNLGSKHHSIDSDKNYLKTRARKALKEK